jgi:hypothetical protein
VAHLRQAICDSSGQILAHGLLVKSFPTFWGVLSLRGSGREQPPSQTAAVSVKWTGQLRLCKVDRSTSSL